MSTIQDLIENMKTIIPDLPGDWAETVALKMGVRREVVWAYANGRRGKRDKQKVLEVHQHMKTLHSEFKKRIEKELA